MTATLTYKIPSLPTHGTPSKYTPLELVEILGYFFVYQNKWPEADTKTNCWDDTTQKTIKQINFVLPSRPVFSSVFGCFENAVDLATRYLSNQDISKSPLLEVITEEDVWQNFQDTVTVDFVVNVFVEYYRHFEEYPSTGPYTWNRNTLFRCKSRGLKLPPFKQCVPKLGTMTFLKREAEQMRRSFDSNYELSSVVKCEVLPPETNSLESLFQENQNLQKSMSEAYEALEELVNKNKQLKQEILELETHNLKLLTSSNKLELSNNLAFKLLFSKQTADVLNAYSNDKNIQLIINLLQQSAESLNVNFD